jgi:hypothetical protein
MAICFREKGKITFNKLKFIKAEIGRKIDNLKDNRRVE